MRWLALVAIMAGTAAADEPPTPFDRGKFGFSGGAGRTGAFDTTYIYVGLGVGYYVLDGVEVGLSAAHFFGDGPSISQVTPSLRYVFQPLVHSSPVIPYIGAFYDHYFVGDMNYSDLDGVGGRAGIMFINGRAVFGIGVGVERYFSGCAKDCTQVFPDVSIGFTL